MEGIAMKNIFLTIALVFTMSVSGSAQYSDGFFNNYDNDCYNRIDDPTGILNMPTGELGSPHNEYAPIGGGLLILTLLGTGYAIIKRKE